MKVNIYYGGRGLIDDPTIFVMNKIMTVLDELNIKVKKYNLYEKVKLRYLSNRLQMYSTVISNAVRSGNYKNAKTDIKNTRNQLLRDKYLNKVKFKYLYNPWFVKLSLLLLKSNNVMFLYLIYLNKENLRLKKLKG